MVLLSKYLRSVSYGLRISKVYLGTFVYESHIRNITNRKQFVAECGTNFVLRNLAAQVFGFTRTTKMGEMERTHLESLS